MTRFPNLVLWMESAGCRVDQDQQYGYVRLCHRGFCNHQHKSTGDFSVYSSEPDLVPSKLLLTAIILYFPSPFYQVKCGK